MKLVLIGAPGAGKGTQAARISAALGIPAISTGDIIRTSIREKTPLGLEMQAVIDSGNLVPDEIICRMVTERLAKPDCRNGFLLDGFPRTIEQAYFLDSAGGIDRVVDLEVSDEDIRKRMTGRRFCPNCQRTYHVVYQKPRREDVCDDCGTPLAVRADDKPETVMERLSVYHEKTEPILRYYAAKTVRIDGNRDPDQVTKDILKALET